MGSGPAKHDAAAGYNFSDERAVRERLYKASVSRANHGGDHDTKSTVTRLAQLRAQKAKLLGYPDHATFILDDQMAKTPGSAEKLMTGIVPAATAKARAEAARMQKLIDAEKGGFQLGPADWEFYAEKVRQAEYDLDESQVKQYFELEHVLQDGSLRRTNSTESLSRSVKTCRSIILMSGFLKCSTRTESRWHCFMLIIFNDRTRSAARGRTVSSIKAPCWVRSRWSLTSATLRSRVRASLHC
jgi:hypothetical protein